MIGGLGRVAYHAGFRLRAWRGYARGSILHWRGASVGRRVVIGRDCRIERPWGVSVGDHASLEHAVWLKLVDDEARITVGARTFIGAGTELDVMQSVEIGDQTLVAPGCFITDHNHGIAVDRRINQQPCHAAPVKIGSDVWIAAKVCILPGVTIGDGAVVGAGAVVRESVNPYSIVAGVPAREVGRRR